MEFDFSFLYFIQENMLNPFLDAVMSFVSFLGNKGAVWIMLALIMIAFKKTRTGGVLVLVAVSLGFVIGELGIKNLVDRVRPCYIDTTVRMIIERPTSSSFPSGHTCSSVAAAAVLFLYDKRFGIPAAILAVLIAFSRMYLFVHFPTDILAGMILGLICAAATYFVYKKFILNREGEKRIETL